MSRKTLNSKRNVVWQAIRRFLIGEEGIAGAALVEFTVLAPILAVMSIYTMDYGLLFYYKLELQNAAQAGAQWAMANRVYNSAAMQQAVLNAAKSRFNNTLDVANITTSQFCGCSENSGGNPIVTQLSAGACNLASATCAHGVPGTYVSVRVTPTTPYHSLIPFGRPGQPVVPNTYTLTATSTARIQ